MSELFPPIIDTYLPVRINDGTDIKIYFLISPYNSLNDILTIDGGGVFISVRSLKTNETVLGKERSIGSVDLLMPTDVLFKTFSAEDKEDNKYYITISTEDLYTTDEIKFQNGDFYKIQLRFTPKTPPPGSNENSWMTDKSNIGLLSEWSSVSLLKVIQLPEIYIRNSSTDNQFIYNTNLIDIYGYVTFGDNDKEELELYRISILNKAGIILELSDWITTNSEDNKNEIIYNAKNILSNNTQYNCIIECLTHSNFYFSKLYEFSIELPDLSLNITSSVKVDTFNARNIITYKIEELLNSGGIYGGISLLRTDVESEYKTYEEIRVIPLVKDDNDYFIVLSGEIYDYAIESIKPYKYAILFAGNKGLRSNLFMVALEENAEVIFDSVMIHSDEEKELQEEIEYNKLSPAVCFYDYNYLVLNNRLLKISLNELINGLQYNVLDGKIDTLGGRYPILTRNSNMYYRTFNINGTISIMSDILLNDEYDIGLFTSRKELLGTMGEVFYKEYNLKNNITNHTDYYLERKYREKVMEFLYDAQPKLFKSTLEGTILVRLLNISLTPNDLLSRLVYSFSCTAIEIDKVTPENLDKYNVQKLGSISIEKEYTPIQYHYIKIKEVESLGI